MAKIFNCATCGKDFVPKRVKKTTKYCSRECYRGKKERPASPKTNGKCGVCGIAIRIFSSRKKENNFCSRKCANIGRRTRPILWKTPERPKCVDCGKEIWYTSKRCGHCCKSGKNSWKWRGGITPINTKIRMSEEYLEWKKKVFYRDNYTCQHCGEVKGRLQAHHHLSFANNINSRFNVDNGITLCKLCHKKHHMLERLYDKPPYTFWQVDLFRNIFTWVKPYEGK